MTIMGGAFRAVSDIVDLGMFFEVAVGQVGDAWGAVGGLTLSGWVLAPMGFGEGLQGEDSGLLEGELAVAAEGEEASASLGPVGDDEGLAAGGVDPEAEAGQLGVPEVAAARALVRGLVDDPLVEPDPHGLAHWDGILGVPDLVSRLL